MIDEPNKFGAGGIAVLLVACAAIAYIGWRGATMNSPTEGLLARVQRTGTIRIGYANEAPYGYLETTTGKVTGEAPEVAAAILKRLGVEHIETVVTEFGSLIPGLKAGRFDMIAAGMYITPKRCRQIRFSNPTYVIGEAFIVSAGNPLALHSYEDVAKNSQARLGLVGGAVQHGYARQSGIADEQIVVFPDNASGVAGVAAGRVDAFAATTLTVGDLLAKWRTADLEQARPFRDPVIDGRPKRGYGAFGFRKRDAEFVKRVNQELAAFLGTSEHLKLIEPFGFGVDTLPGEVTAAALCQ